MLIGEAARSDRRGLRRAAALPVVRAGSMDDAVRAGARRWPRSGDAVLLAPACASFDMFRSYAHRGDVFRDAVLALRKEARA